MSAFSFLAGAHPPAGTPLEASRRDGIEDVAGVSCGGSSSSFSFLSGGAGIGGGETSGGAVVGDTALPGSSTTGDATSETSLSSHAAAAVARPSGGLIGSEGEPKTVMGGGAGGVVAAEQESLTSSLGYAVTVAASNGGVRRGVASFPASSGSGNSSPSGSATAAAVVATAAATASAAAAAVTASTSVTSEGVPGAATAGGGDGGSGGGVLGIMGGPAAPRKPSVGVVRKKRTAKRVGYARDGTAVSTTAVGSLPTVVVPTAATSSPKGETAENNGLREGAGGGVNAEAPPSTKQKSSLAGSGNTPSSGGKGNSERADRGSTATADGNEKSSSSFWASPTAQPDKGGMTYERVQYESSPRQERGSMDDSVVAEAAAMAALAASMAPGEVQGGKAKADTTQVQSI